MKNLLELTEVTKSDLPSIYCDMDQVLCNFMKGADDAVGGEGFVRMKDRDKRWKLISQKKDFWANLEWMPSAKRLYDFIIRYDAYILSASTSRDPNSVPGKMKWLKKNTKFKRSKINLVQRSQKQAYALSNGKPNFNLSLIIFIRVLISLIVILNPCPARGWSLCNKSPKAKILS